MSAIQAAAACRVMIVEDDRQTGAALKSFLTRLGYSVSLAFTVHEAINGIATFRPRCIILDLMLPDGSGARVLRHVREKQPYPSVAILTASQDPQLMKEIDELRPELVLHKPLEMSKLMTWLASIARETAHARKS